MRETLTARLGTVGATLAMTAAGVAGTTMAPTPANACGSGTQSYCQTTVGCVGGGLLMETCCTDGGCSVDCQYAWVGCCC